MFAYITSIVPTESCQHIFVPPIIVNALCSLNFQFVTFFSSSAVHMTVVITN